MSRGIESAVEEERSTRIQSTVSFGATLFVCLFLVPGFWGFGLIAQKLVDGDARPPTRHHRKVLMSTGRPDAELGSTVNARFPSPQTSYFVYLRRGDAVQLDGASDHLQVTVQSRRASSWYAPEWSWVAAQLPAKYEGWYRILLTQPPADEGKPQFFRLSMTGPTG